MKLNKRHLRRIRKYLSCNDHNVMYRRLSGLPGVWKTYRYYDRVCVLMKDGKRFCELYLDQQSKTYELRAAKKIAIKVIRYWRITPWDDY